MSNNNRNKPFTIHEDVENFAYLTKKRYAKKIADPYTDKKDIGKEYLNFRVDLLPAVIETIVRYSNVAEVREIAPSIYDQFLDDKFLARLKKRIEKDGESAFDNVESLPILINEVLKYAAEYQKKLQTENDKNVTIDTTDLIDISSMILKRKLKRLKKAGIPEDLAFDALSVFPTSKYLDRNLNYRLRQLFIVLYEHAKTKDINFTSFIKYVIKEEMYPTLMVFLLLEKKEFYTQFTDKQKAFFNAISDWVFTTMEEMPKEQIMNIIKSYADVRKRDKDQGRDSNRRYFLTSLPESDFPRISKVIAKYLNSNEDMKDMI